MYLLSDICPSFCTSGADSRFLIDRRNVDFEVFERAGIGRAGSRNRVLSILMIHLFLGDVVFVHSILLGVVGGDGIFFMEIVSGPDVVDEHPRLSNGAHHVKTIIGAMPSVTMVMFESLVKMLMSADLHKLESNLSPLRHSLSSHDKRDAHPETGPPSHETRILSH
jgi:hypothetical protein